MHGYIKPYPQSSVQRECSNCYSKMSLLSLIKENYSCFLCNLLVLIVMQDRRYKRHQFSFSPGVLNKKAYSVTTIVHFIGLLHPVRTYILPGEKPKQYYLMSMYASLRYQIKSVSNYYDVITFKNFSCQNRFALNL